MTAQSASNAVIVLSTYSIDVSSEDGTYGDTMFVSASTEEDAREIGERELQDYGPDFKITAINLLRSN